MRLRTAAVTAALLLATATACASSTTTSSSTPPPAAPPATAPASASSVGSAQPSAPAAGAGGLPPKPDAATTARYIAALDAIDPDIVHGKEDAAVSRGRDQCSSIGQHKSQDELIKLTLQRFTSPTHPQGHGPEKAAKILTVVHDNICPTF